MRLKTCKYGIILSDYFCFPTFIRFTEKWLQVPLGSIEPANIGYQKLRQIIQVSYRVYNDHFVEYQKVFCGKCAVRILLPDPPEQIFRSTCCNANLCLKCAIENVCPKCLNYTIPSFPNKLEEEFSYAKSSVKLLKRYIYIL